MQGIVTKVLSPPRRGEEPFCGVLAWGSLAAPTRSRIRPQHGTPRWCARRGRAAAGSGARQRKRHTPNTSARSAQKSAVTALKTGRTVTRRISSTAVPKNTWFANLVRTVSSSSSSGPLRFVRLGDGAGRRGRDQHGKGRRTNGAGTHRIRHPLLWRRRLSTILHAACERAKPRLRRGTPLRSPRSVSGVAGRARRACRTSSTRRRTPRPLKRSSRRRRLLSWSRGRRGARRGTAGRLRRAR